MQNVAALNGLVKDGDFCRASLAVLVNCAVTHWTATLRLRAKFEKEPGTNFQDHWGVNATACRIFPESILTGLWIIRLVVDNAIRSETLRPPNSL